MTLAPLRVQEAKDSLVKASTPEPFSTSRTSNWVARGGGLPDYVQHIAHDLMEKRGKSESEAIQMAVGIVKRWARGGGKVDSNTRAAAAKALAEWERLKAGSHAKVKESLAPSWGDEQALVEGAVARLTVFEAQFGLDGLVTMLASGPLVEASAWQPTLKPTVKAAEEKERHDVSDGSQSVGTVACQRGIGPSEGDRWRAQAVNGQRVGGYGLKSKNEALDALQTHLSEAPARVIAMPTAGQYLVAHPSSYGETTYRAYPSEAAARHAAGLPAQPTVPEINSKVGAVAEMLRFDLMTVSGLELPPLRRVQEARRRDPFDLIAEAFDPGELRDFRGRWQHGDSAIARMVRPGGGQRRGGAPRVPGLPADERYAGGAVRASAKARAAHAAKPQIALKDLKNVGRGKWSGAADRVAKRLQSQKGDEFARACEGGEGWHGA